MKKNPTLSVVIVSYNTKELLSNCLHSLKKVEKELDFEVIVSDNGSIDGSVELVKEKFPNTILIENKINLGFAKGNNVAKKYCRGECVLFLNSDTEVYPHTLKKTVEYLKSHPEVGALTCKLILPSGKLDKDARRRFPTPKISFKRLFLGNTRDYWYEDVDPDIVQEVDVIQGAYFLVEKKLLDKVGWFDEDYFLDGEDIDLCWKIKESGYKIVYYPVAKTLHVKKASKKKLKRRSRSSGVRAMEIFYRKHLWSRYPIFINWLVVIGIRLMLFVRLAKSLI